jgi:stalled ribosome rescue protein Dom34
MSPNAASGVPIGSLFVAASGTERAQNVAMQQTAIWIDHDEAHVFHVDGKTVDKETIHAPNHHVHRHPKGQETKAANLPADEGRFFDAVLAVLADSDQILISGPSVTKLHFMRYAEKHSPTFAARVMGIETADHPTDRQLVAHIRHYFHSDPPRGGVGPSSGSIR